MSNNYYNNFKGYPISYNYNLTNTKGFYIYVVSSLDDKENDQVNEILMNMFSKIFEFFKNKDINSIAMPCFSNSK